MNDLKREPLQDRLRALQDSLLAGLVEREDAVRLALLAALAGEHMLMIGPPGTAKSLVAQRLHLAFADAAYFERLLTRFTVPEELFGPLSIQGLEQDRYQRLTDGYMPSASVAFLDEIFKANSAILNALLTLLNERRFDNGQQRVKTPLVAVLGASNELPEGEELAALFDRFLLRLHVGPVSKDGFLQMVALRGEATPEVPEALRLTAADLEEIQAKIPKVEVPQDVVGMLVALREWCQQQEIPVSDRRWRKVVKLLQASAYTNGREAVSVWDCWLLQHCLWHAPEQREGVYAWYAERVGADARMDPVLLDRVVRAHEARLDSEASAKSQMRDSQGRDLFVDAEGKNVVEAKHRRQKLRDGERLYLAPDEAWRDSYHDDAVTRKDGGRGFTLSELNSLYINRHHRFENWAQKNQYIADESNWYMENAPLPPAMEPTRYAQSYISQKQAELTQDRDRVLEHGRDIQRQLQSINDDIRSHLWVHTDFVEFAQRHLTRSGQAADSLRARLDALIQGYGRLPKQKPLPKPEDAASK